MNMFKYWEAKEIARDLILDGHRRVEAVDYAAEEVGLSEEEKAELLKDFEEHGCL